MASKWEDIGIQLDIDDGSFGKIKADHPRESRDCLRELLRTWLKKADPAPSWNYIIEALEYVGEEKLSQELKGRYCV